MCVHTKQYVLLYLKYNILPSLEAIKALCLFFTFLCGMYSTQISIAIYLLMHALREWKHSDKLIFHGGHLCFAVIF